MRERRVFARAERPYTFLHSADHPDAVVFCSVKAAHKEFGACLNRARELGSSIFVISCRPKTDETEGALRQTDRWKWWTSKILREDGFLSVGGVLALLSSIPFLGVDESMLEWGVVVNAVVGRAFADHRQIEHDYLSTVGGVLAVGLGWGLLGALDLESRIAESGSSVGAVWDPGDLGHGRYVSLVRGKNALVVFGTKECDDALERLVSNIPGDMPLVCIRAPFSGLEGGIYCTTRSILLAGELIGRHGGSNDAEEVAWGRKLYEIGGLL